MMKYILPLLSCFVLFISTESFGQSCCKQPAKMEALALQTDFKAAHLSPEPLDYFPERGLMIDIMTDSGIAKAFHVPSIGPCKKVLIIFHEWWGLNDYIKKEAERLQFELGDVEVYAIDLYDGKVATNAEQASKYMAALSPRRGAQIVRGLLRVIGPEKKIATLGWCMGGTWSYKASTLARKQSVGCVMYYGFPDLEKKNGGRAASDVLYIYGTKDKFIKEVDVISFGEKVKESKHDFTLKRFDAEHAFANPSNPKHNASATTEANAIVIAFLRNKFPKAQ